MQHYQDGVYLAESSACAQALKDKKPSQAQAIFNETTKRFKQQFPTRHREWFECVTQHGLQSVHRPHLSGLDFDTVQGCLYNLRLLNYHLRIKYSLAKGGYVLDHPPEHPIHGAHDLRSLRAALEVERRNLAMTLDSEHVTVEDRTLVRNAPYWKIAVLLY